MYIILTRERSEGCGVADFRDGKYQNRNTGNIRYLHEVFTDIARNGCGPIFYARIYYFRGDPKICDIQCQDFKLNKASFARNPQFSLAILLCSIWSICWLVYNIGQDICQPAFTRGF